MEDQPITSNMMARPLEPEKVEDWDPGMEGRSRKTRPQALPLEDDEVVSKPKSYDEILKLVEVSKEHMEELMHPENIPPPVLLQPDISLHFERNKVEPAPAEYNNIIKSKAIVFSAPADVVGLAAVHTQSPISGFPYPGCLAHFQPRDESKSSLQLMYAPPYTDFKFIIKVRRTQVEKEVRHLYSDPLAYSRIILEDTLAGIVVTDIVNNHVVWAKDPWLTAILQQYPPSKDTKDKDYKMCYPSLPLECLRPKSDEQLAEMLKGQYEDIPFLERVLEKTEPADAKTAAFGRHHLLWSGFSAEYPHQGRFRPEDSELVIRVSFQTIHPLVAAVLVYNKCVDWNLASILRDERGLLPITAFVEAARNNITKFTREYINSTTSYKLKVFFDDKFREGKLELVDSSASLPLICLILRWYKLGKWRTYGEGGTDLYQATMDKAPEAFLVEKLCLSEIGMPVSRLAAVFKVFYEKPDSPLRSRNAAIYSVCMGAITTRFYFDLVCGPSFGLRSITQLGSRATRRDTLRVIKVDFQEMTPYRKWPVTQIHGVCGSVFDKGDRAKLANQIPSPLTVQYETGAPSGVPSFSLSMM